MHYQIFIPHAQHQTAKVLEDFGLADMVGGAEHRASDGPAGQMGLLLAWRRPGKNERFHFNADEQSWLPALPNGADDDTKGKGRYWVGLWNDSPVTPEDLKRSYQHHGPMVVLGDGNAWRIPTIFELPSDFIRADDGSWKFEIQREYHDIWLEALDWQQRLDAGTVTVDFLNILNFSEKCLRQNYRITTEIVSHLRLFNTKNIADVFGAALGRRLSRDGE